MKEMERYMTVQGDMSFSQLTRPGFVYLKLGMKECWQGRFFSHLLAITLYVVVLCDLAISFFRIPTGLGDEVVFD